MVFLVVHLVRASRWETVRAFLNIGFEGGGPRARGGMVKGGGRMLSLKTHDFVRIQKDLSPSACAVFV
ncbi:MAG TPA: hypothetical protein DCR97_15195 [Deltaproteobacteria bacterium]|nr:hypothetical protein [Deltaproteobacteria bacterium]